MSTKNPRLNVVLEPPLFLAIQQLAKKDGVSLSLKARDLIREALESYEDRYWVRKVAERERTFDSKKSLSHKEVWE